jgi:hypothetical protein
VRVLRDSAKRVAQRFRDALGRAKPQKSHLFDYRRWIERVFDHGRVLRDEQQRLIALEGFYLNQRAALTDDK